MCGNPFKAPKMDQPAPTPPPDPAPVPTPDETAPQSAEQSRRSRVNRLRAGIASTIKTSPRGVTGTGADLYPSMGGGKTKLGT